MALKTFVKISNISNLSDARYCAGMGVDLLGFNLSPAADGKVAPEDFKEIAEWVAGVKFVGELSGAGLEEVKEALKTYQLDMVEVDDESLVEPLSLFNQEVIFKLHIETPTDLQGLRSKLSYLDELVKIVLIKSPDATLFDQIDEQIRLYHGNLTLLKGYGIATGMDLDSYPGIELEATEEERPGFKDYGVVMDILEDLELD